MDKNTIRCYLALSFTKRLAMSFIAATYVTFLIANGLDLFQVNLVNLVFFVTMFACEIPTGAIADVFGRKFSFLCSCFLLTISMLVYSYSTTLQGFIAAEFIGAVGVTCESGAFQAWAVDRLKQSGFKGLLETVFSKEQQLGQAALIIGSISGAFLADKNIVLPWIVGGAGSFLAGVFAIFFMEENFTRKPHTLASALKSLMYTAHTGINYGLRSSAVRFIFLIGVAQSFAIQAPNMQWQPFFARHIPNQLGLGFIFAGIALSAMLGSKLAPWLLGKSGSEKKALLITQVIIGFGILFAALAGRWFSLAISIFLFHEVARGLFIPIKSKYLNDNIPSKERATIISCESIAHHLGGAIGLVVSGAVAQYVSIESAWILSGSSLMAIAFLFFCGRIKGEK